MKNQTGRQKFMDEQVKQSRQLLPADLPPNKTSESYGKSPETGRQKFMNKQINTGGKYE